MAQIVVLLLGVVLVGLSVLLLVGSRSLGRRGGLPAGRLISSDMREGGRGKALYSPRYGLTGTPDYLLETHDGLVPVEVKPGRTESEPHESHMLQVLAYCLLIEETQGKPPPYGLLRYSSETFRVDYNRQTRAYLLNVIEEMRAAARVGEPGPPRNHGSAGRCRACGYRGMCDQVVGY